MALEKPGKLGEFFCYFVATPELDDVPDLAVDRASWMGMTTWFCALYWCMLLLMMSKSNGTTSTGKHRARMSVFMCTCTHLCLYICDLCIYMSVCVCIC